MKFGKLEKHLGLAGFTVTSVILMSHSLSRPSMAQDTDSFCPGIFYQEPFTSRVAAPAGCPLTEYQRTLEGSAQTIDPSLMDQPESLEALETAETGELGVNSSEQAIRL